MADDEICGKCGTELHPRFRCECFRAERFAYDGAVILGFLQKCERRDDLSERDQKMVAAATMSAFARNRLRNGQVMTLEGLEQKALECDLYNRLPKFFKSRTGTTGRSPEPIG